MLTFLNSLPIWFGLAAAVPVLIHFIGRSRSKKIDFPSLLLFKEKFEHTSRRHKIKNLLLLICRILFILCLLAALLNPVLKTESLFKKDTACISVIHNGAWSLLTFSGDTTLFDKQTEMAGILAKSTGSQSSTIYFFKPDNNPENPDIVLRSGDYPEVIKQIELWLETRNHQPVNCYLPVFDWTKLENSVNAVKDICAQNPLLRLVLIDYSPVLDTLENITGIRAGAVEEKPVMRIEYSIQNLRDTKEGKRIIQTYFSEQLSREQSPKTSDLEKNIYTLNFNLAPGHFISGALALKNSAGEHPFSVRYFSFRQPRKVTILHTGSEFTSLPSLGNQSFFKNLIHVDKIMSDSLINNFAGFDAIYMANTFVQNQRAYGELLNYVKRGGTLVMGIGSRSDLSNLNREILVPAKIGYLRLMESFPSDSQGKLKAVSSQIESNQEELNNISPILSKLVPAEAEVRTQLSLKTHSSAKIILSNPNGPLLIHGKYRKGDVFLWTTDIDNLEWTTMGASAFIPVFHQSIMEGDNTSWQSFGTVSDSVFNYRPRNESHHKIIILGPDGKIFNRTRSLYKNMIIGPFNKLGHYKIIDNADTTILAVNIEFPDGKTVPEDVMKQLASVKSQIQLLAPEEIFKKIQGSANPLWKPLLLSALFFFLMEIVILLYFNSSSVKKKT